MKTIIPSLLFFLFLLVSCKDSADKADIPQPEKITTNQKQLISSFTSGRLDKQDKIIVNFADALSAIPKEGDYLTFEPAIKGKCSFVNKSTLIFEPSEDMLRGEYYLAKLNLKDLFPHLKGEDLRFEFSFYISQLSLRVSVDGLEWDKAADNTYKLVGAVHPSEIVESELIEKCLQVEPANLHVVWEHNANERSSRFTVQGIKRIKEEQKISISYNGEPLGIKNASGSYTKVVPAIGDFRVIDLVNRKESNLRANLLFSEKLDPEQDLKGLIEVKDYNGELSFAIENNSVTVFLSKTIKGEIEFLINKGVKNEFGNPLQHEASFKTTFDEEKPGVALLGKGVILPKSESVLFPFKAVNLRAVDVEIFKIFDNNILQYFQNSYYNFESYNQSYVGRIVQQTSIDLKELNQNANQGAWTNYALDLSELINVEPGAMYDVRIGFRKEYAITNCEDNTNEEPLDLEVNKMDENKEYNSWFSNYYGRYGYYQNFHQEQDDPCKNAFYANSKFVHRKVYSSNIGVIAKKGSDGSLFLSSVDLSTAIPIANADIELYDLQQQLIKKIRTGSDGAVSTNVERTARFAVASHNGQKGIIALEDGKALSLSNFDVSGAKAQAGLKGQFYTARGVWRPGDDIYLNFVLEDAYDKLPDNHPVSLRFIDPSGKEYTKINTIQNVNGVYPFELSTDMESPTGNWRVELSIGTATFNKRLKIETVKPNRLKIRFDIAEEMVKSKSKNIDTEMTVNWLVGTPTKNAKANVEMLLKKGKANFEKYSDFTFTDPTRLYEGESELIFDGKTNEAGKARVFHLLGDNTNLPGMMSLSFQTKAFEPGGDFSIDNFTVPYSPFDVYTGIKLPKTDYGRDRLNYNEDNILSFVSVDENGKSVKGRKLTGAIYRLSWRWWWNRSRDFLSQYNTSNYSKAVEAFNIDTDQEYSTYNFKPKEWGRYLVRVCDEVSGHCSGKIFYAGYPYGDDDSNDYATMLTLSTDKEEYKTGEEVKLSFPSGSGGKALVSIENGTKVLQTFWIDTQDKKTEFSFYTEPDMAPSIYANVTYIQPHASVKNDLPIRMYGIIPISVYDQNTKLSPEIVTSDEFQPEEKVSIQVSEKEGRDMTYTVAVVDEGLLDLTRFKTPDLWEKFYVKEALGVKTWDLYDYVMGSFAGQIDRIVSIGGDEELNPDDKKNKANRFKPVVQHFGPFHLKPGNKKTHDFVMPNYIGSVRVMVVAAHEGAYGKTEKTVPVKKPLMVLSSLPRVLSPTESMQLPISVFALEDKIKNVKVTVEESEGLVKFPKGKTQQITFTEKGEQMAYFDMEVLDKMGVAKFNIIVESGGERATQEIELQIDNPNEIVTTVTSEILQPGENWEHILKPFGSPGTNEALLEVYNIPPLNLEKRLGYLLRYPHGCLEQTTSKSFPQLYLDRFVELTSYQKEQRVRNINHAIDKISTYLNTDGSFSYWPGSYVNHWANTYAGHFLLEAKSLGFIVSSNLTNSWLRFQKNQAVQYRTGSKDWSNNDLTQAYRLYTLAKAGVPELGAMNRLRQSTTLSSQAAWRLAAAYAMASRPEVANDIADGLSSEIKEYDPELGYNFGSPLRDQGMLLETMVLLEKDKEALDLLNNISAYLTSKTYYNTHGLSMALMGVGKLISEQSHEPLHFRYKQGSKNAVDINTDLPVSMTDVDPENNANQKIEISNTSQDVLYIRLVSSGKPLVGPTEKKEKHLKMDIRYLDGAGNELNISSIDQSTDIIAELTVQNSGTYLKNYRNLALTQTFPSGWEIINDRLTGVDNKFTSSTSTYQDIRDDRIHTYFNLNKGEKKTFYTRLTATYQGDYYLPNQVCKAMYDESIFARIPSQSIKINSTK